MMLSEKDLKTVLKWAGIGIAATAAYYIIKGDDPQKAIEKPLKVVSEVSDAVGHAAKQTGKRLKKGTKEAKERMMELARISAEKRKNGTAKSKKKKKKEAVTDAEIIKKHKLKGKEAEAVKSGKVVKKKGKKGKKK